MGMGTCLFRRRILRCIGEFYLDLTNRSGQFGHTVKYPDGLVPIGKDAYYHEQRNGAPFDVASGKNQAGLDRF